MSDQFIRPATAGDVSRLAEILVFNNRINFYPIFRCDEFSFGEMQVIPIANQFLADPQLMARTFVYDDGIVRGMMVLDGDEVKRLFVEPSFQGRGIGAALLRFAMERHHVTHLWALEKNTRAIRFYERHGFRLTDEKVFEEDTTEYLIHLKR
ncbi:MAG: GNAT family N-acetyltransferase [Clostridiales bacterium]|nr:GNAT family N-acetyltransferase [Clostridiales bacterium]